MKARILCLLLLSACDDQIAYDYALSWVCLSPEGCERTEEVSLIDRLNEDDDYFFFHSTRDDTFFEGAQRFGSESLPEGCWWLYGFSVFGQELEPAKHCTTADGLELEFSIPNRNPSTHSLWCVKARELGPI